MLESRDSEKLRAGRGIGGYLIQSSHLTAKKAEFPRLYGSPAAAATKSLTQG